jgi:hypothetical protein
MVVWHLDFSLISSTRYFQTGFSFLVAHLCRLHLNNSHEECMYFFSCRTGRENSIVEYFRNRVTFVQVEQQLQAVASGIFINPALRNSLATTGGTNDI